MRSLLTEPARRRAAIAFLVFFLVWEAGSTSQSWLGLRLPVLGHVPSPIAVLQVWRGLLASPSYWASWYLSSLRVLEGFLAALVVGVPFGFALAASPVLRGIVYPVFEVLRPIPPLAWVPAAVIFWPTQELSIDSVIFLGAFYTIVLNVLGGTAALDRRFLQVAASMGSSRLTAFRRVLLPGILPSVFVGMEVGIGITWEVVVAAEMISGGGGGAGGGLGFFIWNSYVGGSYAQIVVGMISIGVAGALSSAAIRALEPLCTPWRVAR